VKKTEKVNFSALDTGPKRLSPEQDSVSFHARVIDNKDRQSVYCGTRLMRSERWAADGERSKIVRRGIPFVMKSGLISGSCTMNWRCSSYQWIATVIRLVLQRIKRLNVVSRRSRYKTWHQLTTVAAYYVVTNDEHGFQRLLHCKKEGFVGTMHYLKHRMDEQKRFLFDQTLQGVLWFQLRGNPRVKSIKKTIYEKYRNFSVRNFDTAHIRRLQANAICDPWIVSSKCMTKSMCLLRP